MSVNPVDSFYQAERLFNQKGADRNGGRKNPAFADALAAIAEAPPLKPPSELSAAAAEIFRLDMMRNALAGEEAPSIGLPEVSSRRALATLLKEIDEKRGQDVHHPTPTTVPPKVEELPQAPPPRPTASGLDAIVHRASRRHGVPEELIRAVIKAESNFNPQAVSHAGAQGLMQLMPATARGLGVSNAFDPEQNVMAGTRFLKDLLNRYDGNLDQALAAYNWGPGNVDRGGRSLPRETREYLSRVKKYMDEYAG